MATEWHDVINGYFQFGVDWQMNTTNTAVTVAPIIYRWDKYDTNNSGGRYYETLSPDPSGAGSWGPLTYGSGSGTRQIDTFATRTYTRKESAYTVSLTLRWTNTGSAYSGSYHGTADSSSTWTITVPALPSYNVTYNANGGSGQPSTQKKYYGKTLTLSSTVPTKPGSVFSKWNTQVNGSGDSYNAGASYTKNAAVTLYAQWTQSDVTITYNANGGSNAPSKQTVSAGTASNLSNTKPTMTNATFVKWNTKSNGSGTSYNSGASITVTANTTLYAIYKTNLGSKLTLTRDDKGSWGIGSLGGVGCVVWNGTVSVVNGSATKIDKKAFNDITLSEWYNALKDATAVTVSFHGATGQTETVSNKAITVLSRPTAIKVENGKTTTAAPTSIKLQIPNSDIVPNGWSHNIITNGCWTNGKTGWTEDGLVINSIKDNATYGKVAYITDAPTGSKRIYWTTSNLWVAGKTYIYTAYVNGSSGMKLRFSRSLGDYSSKTFTMDGTSKSVTGLIHCTSTASGGTLSIQVSDGWPSSDGYLYITNIKLEEYLPTSIKVNV